MKNGVLRLLPGFRFHPTDQELVLDYLKPKVLAFPLPASIIPEVHLCNSDPWDLPGQSVRHYVVLYASLLYNVIMLNQYDGWMDGCMYVYSLNDIITTVIIINNDGYIYFSLIIRRLGARKVLF